MALSEAERKAMTDYQALLGELDEEDPSFLKKGAPKPEPVETRPFPRGNTGPDLAGQFRREIAGLTPDRDLTGTPDGPVGKYSPTTMGQPGNVFLGSPGEEARGFRDFAAGMAAPELAAIGGNRLLTGAVARSAAREPGAVIDAIKDVPRTAIDGNMRQALAYTLPRTARAGAMAADETLAAAGRAIGIKPYSPVNYTQPLNAHPLPATPEQMVPPRIGANDLVSIGEATGVGAPVPRPAPDTRGIPNQVMPELTTPIPRQPMSEMVPPARGGVDLAAEQARKAALPDDTAALDRTQRIPVPENPGWSKNPRGTGYNKVDTTPSGTNVQPGPSTEGMTPAQLARRQAAQDAQDARFAKGMGLSVEDYRAMLARRAQRVPQSLQKFQQTGDEASLRKDLTDSIFEDGP